jgi:uncharacterized radical SAM superfamily Fe-S cluster-containing enzyme
MSQKENINFDGFLVKKIKEERKNGRIEIADALEEIQELLDRTAVREE